MKIQSDSPTHFSSWLLSQVGTPWRGFRLKTFQRSTSVLVKNVVFWEFLVRKAWKTSIEYEIHKLIPQLIIIDMTSLTLTLWQEGCRRAYEFLVPSFCATSLALAESGALPQPLLSMPQVAPTRSMTRTWLAKRRRPKSLRCFEELRITTIYPKNGLHSRSCRFAWEKFRFLSSEAACWKCLQGRMWHQPTFLWRRLKPRFCPTSSNIHSGHSCCFCLAVSACPHVRRCGLGTFPGPEGYGRRAAASRGAGSELYERFLSGWEVVKNPCHVQGYVYIYIY